MYSVEIIFITLLAAITAIICYRTIHTTQVAQWRQAITNDLKGGNESIGFIGCSVITHDITRIKDIESLLSNTYNRYEVIIMLNSSTHSNTFRQIIKQYQLTIVNHSQPHSTPSYITELYRSANQTYRRLVLIDYSTTDIYSAINSAIEFASYDYIIPLQSNTLLLPHAIENIAITLSDTSNRNIQLIHNNTIAQCYVFQRDSILIHGGLSHDIITKIPRHSILHSNIAFAYRRDVKHSSIFITGLTILSLNALACALSTHAAIAFIVAITLVITASHFILQQWSVPNCSIKSILCQIRNLTTFFNSLKFNIS